MPARPNQPTSLRCIVTDRLRLRAPRVSDFADMSAMWADPEIMRHISGQPSSPSESWSRLLRYIGHWHAMGFGILGG